MAVDGKSAVLRARLIPRVISIERISVRGGEVQRGRGPLSTQSDDYTYEGRVSPDT